MMSLRRSLRRGSFWTDHSLRIHARRSTSLSATGSSRTCSSSWMPPPTTAKLSWGIARCPRANWWPYGALLAHGTDVDAKGVEAMIPGLQPSQVSVAMRALEGSGRLRRANERVAEFQSRIQIAALCGDGDKAPADMVSLDASWHLWNARVDPRRRTYAAVSTPCARPMGIFYDQPIVLNDRQAGVAIEGSGRTTAPRTGSDYLCWRWTRNAVPVQVVHNDLGHVSLRTTSCYLTAERDTRLAAIDRKSVV